MQAIVSQIEQQDNTEQQYKEYTIYSHCVCVGVCLYTQSKCMEKVNVSRAVVHAQYHGVWVCEYVSMWVCEYVSMLVC